MTYTVYQNIGGRVYAYETEAYWDKEKKMAKQRRRYLGRVDPETGAIIPKKVIKAVGALDYGDVAFVLQCFEEVGLQKVLQQVYGTKVATMLKILSISKVVEQCPLVRIERWFDRTYLRSWDVALSSQNISRMLGDIGEDDGRLQQFFAGWIGKWKGRHTLFYDITSMESQSKLNDLLEYGYSRGAGGLPQLNLGIVVNYDTSLPLYYKIFPGSLPDVRTLRNMIVELKTLGIRECLLILDRGFYSRTNLLELTNENIDFLVPLPFSTNLSETLVAKHNKDLETPENVVSHRGKILYVVDGKIKLDRLELYYLLYYDKKRAVEETNKFYNRLFQIENKLRDVKIRAWTNVKEVVEEIAGKYISYIDWSIEGNGISFRRKRKAITRFINRLGKTILLSSRELDWAERLDFYQSKNDVERAFRTMKSDLEGLPMRTHNSSTTKGYLFVIFLSSVIFSHIRKKLRESRLQMSLPDVLMELSKIRKIVMADGKQLVTEITKTQRNIIKVLGVRLLEES